LAINESEASSDIERRREILNKYFTKSLYDNVCRSLFEKDKMLFSFLLTIKIMQGNNLVDPIEWRYFLAGPSGEIKIIDNPFKWVSNIEWPEKYRQLFSLDKLKIFEGFHDYFLTHGQEFEQIFSS